ncbi:acetyltransferase [Vibrio sp. B183]|nr:acetyltransferase [Vibrio sp. B183]
MNQFPARVLIRPAVLDDLVCLYELQTKHTEWTLYDGPYFPYSPPTLEAYKDSAFVRLIEGKDMQVITYKGKPVGTVGCYWECEETRWLEAGVSIYDSRYWGRGIASRALAQWVTFLFANYKIERVGLTTWSGNPRMMSCASKLGFKQEACLRSVRYFQGIYYDSVKYGVLRSEWHRSHSIEN